MQKLKDLEFLKQVNYFKSWSLIKLQAFNKLINEKNYNVGDVIYN